MDTTDCLGLPYPECNPPLVKDASDIEQFRDLAIATDTAVQTLADSISATLTNPPAVAMTNVVVAAGAELTHFLNVTDFDNAGMADLASDVIRIQEDGWYMVGGYVSISFVPQTAFFMRVEPLVNGDVFTSRQGPSFTNVTDEPLCFADIGFFRSGDALNLRTSQAGSSLNFHTYNIRMWCLQVLASV